jgi:hypothetical protein
VLTIVVTTLIEGYLFPGLPPKERMVAVRAEVFRLFVFTETLVSLKQVAADLASKLRFLPAVVAVEIVMRGIADRTNDQFRN